MTDPVVPSYINPLPPAPEVTDSVPEFDSKAFPFVEALVDLTGEINATVAGTYQNALASGEGAVTSTASAGVATTAKNDAVTAKNAAQAAQVAAEAARDDALTNTKGWSPMLRLENDGDRRVLFVYDWTGGAGTKPSTTGYIGASGLTPNKSLAIDVRGKQGLPGTGGDLMQILGGFDASNQTPITDTDTLLGGIGKAQGQINKANSTLSKAVLTYPDYATAEAAAATLPDGQVVEVEIEQKRYRVNAGALVFLEDMPLKQLGSASVGLGAALVAFKQNEAGAAARTVAEKISETISPKDFGAKGDGIADDGDQLNLALAAFRAKVNTIVNQGGCINLDLAGGVYRTTKSINATGLSSWGWKISNGTIVGECVGKNVVDFIGSRGGCVSNLVVIGSKESMPRVGIMVARSTAGGQKAFCDNTVYENVTTNGHFSLAGGYFYAQETTSYIHCRFWNANKDGYAAIHTGNDSVAAVQSEYETPVTGGHSYINNKYINCDWRFLPSGATALITFIGNSNNPRITAAGHPFKNGDEVVIGGITSGMTGINNLKGTVESSDSDGFTLNGVDATTFDVFSGTATAVISQTKPTVYLSRVEQHSFDTCYAVNYGTDNIEINFSDSAVPKDITLDILGEGIGSRSLVRFTGLTSNREVIGFNLKTYNTHCRESVISKDSPTNNLLVYKASIFVANSSYSSPVLFDTPARYALYDADVFFPSHLRFDPKSLGDYTGSAGFVSNGQHLLHKPTLYSPSVIDTIDGSFTPVIESTTGAITAYTVNACTVKKIGDIKFLFLDVTITDNGTGATAIMVSGLPFVVATTSVFYGRKAQPDGKMLQGYATAGTSFFLVHDYANQYPGGTGARLVLSGAVY